MTTLLEALKELNEDLTGLDPEKMYACEDDEVFEYICDTAVEDSVEFDDITVTITYLSRRGFYAYPNGDPGEPDEYDDYEKEVSYCEEDIQEEFADEIYEAIGNLWSEKFGDRDEVTGKEIMEADWLKINEIIEPKVREAAEEHAQEAANDGVYDDDYEPDYEPEYEPDYYND